MRCAVRLSNAIVWLLLSAVCAAATGLPRSVLILDESAGAAAGPFYASIVSAVRSSVNRQPSNQLSIFVEHLDLSRFRGADYESAVTSYLAAKYHGRPIGVVVAVGIGALRYIVQHRAELWPAVPVVFTFVDPAALGPLELPSDITGTTFRLTFAAMVGAARAVVPDLTGVAVVGDAVDTLVPYRHFVHEIPEVAAGGMQIIDLMGMPLRDVRTRVASLPARTAIIYTVMYSDGEGKYLAPIEALSRFAGVANRPIVVTAETQIGQGAIGGYIAVPGLLGELAGSQALRILQGESPAAIPIREGDVVRPVFDWRQLQRWGVSTSQLPPGSEIRFRQLGVWDRYLWQIIAIIAAVVLQAGLIYRLLYERRQRQSSELVARNTLSELAHVNRLATGNELSASIAHEVMQPLTGIISSANAGLRWLSAATPDVEKARAMLNQIVTAGHRTAEVVRATRAMYKRESNIAQPVRMNDLIEEALDLVKGTFHDHDVIVETHLNELLPVVMGDPIQLQQVLLNLITNAVEAMRDVPGADKVLRVRTEIEEGGIRISVEDSGVGVSPDKLEEIFKPLFSTKEQGMGLGLSICRSIVEAQHGRIWASPNQPNGLAVHFYLPVRQS